MTDITFSCSHKECESSFSTQDELEDHIDEEHTCLICAKIYTEVERKKLQCFNQACPGFCKKCMKDFLNKSEDTGNGKLNCLACDSELNLDYIMSIGLGTSVFRNKAFRKLQEVFLASQKSLLPQTQSYAQYIKDTEDYNKEIKPVFLEKIQSLQREISDLKLIMIQCKPVEGNSGGQFIFPCPEESCTGFIENNGICKLCSKEFCSECRELKSEDHVCNPGILESIKLIKINSKPCPYEDCGVYISKIDGCDQMWCAKCKRFWSWDKEQKLNIVSRQQAHNPEFLAYERRTIGANIRTDVPNCDLVPENSWEILNILKRNRVLNRVFYDYYAYIFSQHINWLINDLRRDPEKTYKKLRADYLLKKIDAKTLDKKLLSTKLKSVKDEKISLILEDYRRSKNLIIKNLLEISEKNKDSERIRLSQEDHLYIYKQDYELFRKQSKYNPPIFLLEIEVVYAIINEIISLDKLYQREIDKITFSMGYKKSLQIRDTYYEVASRRRGFNFYSKKDFIDKSNFVIAAAIDFCKKTKI